MNGSTIKNNMERLTALSKLQMGAVKWFIKFPWELFTCCKWFNSSLHPLFLKLFYYELNNNWGSGPAVMDIKKLSSHYEDLGHLV